MQTHFFMETVTTASRVWGRGGAGGCAEWARERFFHMNEQMNEGLKKKNPNQKLFKVTN